MKITFLSILGLFLVGIAVPSFAHTTAYVEQYEIEAGWSIEPPVVGIRNDLVLKVIERGEAEGTFTGITGAFKGIDATILFGGASKQIDINADPKPGYYFSPIIPTKTGTYMVELKGDIGNIPVDVQISIEDVESTAILDFPPSSSGGDTDVIALKNAISSMQQDVSELKSGISQTTDGGTSYDFAVFGLSIAAAAIILAIIALVKRK